MKIQLTEKEMKAIMELQIGIEGETNINSVNSTIDVEEDLVIRIIEEMSEIALPLNKILEETNTELADKVDTDLNEIALNFGRIITDKRDCLMDATLARMFGKSLLKKNICKKIIVKNIDKAKSISKSVNDRFLSKLNEIYSI